MSGATLGFFIAGVLVAFLFALAVQMRVMAGLVLRRAAQGRLSDVFVQGLRAQAGIRDEVFNLVFGGNDALFRRRHALLPYSWA